VPKRSRQLSYLSRIQNLVGLMNHSLR